MGDPKALSSIISQVELARISGTNRQVVYKACIAGHIKTKLVRNIKRVVFDHESTQRWYQGQIAKNAKAPLQGTAESKQGEKSKPSDLISLQREKILEEIGKIRADKRLKELQYKQKRSALIEKDTVAAVLFQYMDALNINMLDVPEMIVDTIMDKVKAGASRGEIIKVMRDKNQKAIVNTKKQVKERLK